MRQLIESVRAEAVKAFNDATDADHYHTEELAKNARTRDDATQRIKDCDEALTAITNAAKQIAGVTP